MQQQPGQSAGCILLRVHRAAAGGGGEASGGGILVDHGAHIFYQLRALLGEPKTVQATVRTLQHHSYRVEDTALVVLDSKGNERAVHKVGYGARLFVACESVNWNWPEPGGVSTTGPRFDHCAKGSAMFVVAWAVKLAPLG